MTSLEVFSSRILYLVVVEMAIDRETMAPDLPLVTRCPHIATATHPNITACAHQLWGVLLHGLQAPGVWKKGRDELCRLCPVPLEADTMALSL